MMITQPPTGDFNIYVQQVIKVDNALRALNQTRGPTYQTQTQNQTPRAPTTASGTAPGPMDLSASSLRIFWKIALLYSPEPLSLLNRWICAFGHRACKSARNLRNLLDISSAVLVFKK